MSTEEKSDVGLDYLSDEDLAAIAVTADSYGRMTKEAQIAFQELARRSGRTIEE